MKKILSISVFLILVVIEIYAQCPPDAPTGNSPQSFCTGNNPTIANLTATGTTIQWYAAATGGSPLATSIALIDGTTYFASQTISECESVIRLAVAVILNDPAAPTGNSVQSFCAINNPTIDNLTAEGTSIQWYPAATGGTALSSSTPLVSGTTYYAGQTIGGCISDTRLAVAVTVGDPSAPTGISSQSFCAINNPTIANLTAAGTAIQWYISPSGGTALSTSTALVNGTTYYAGQTTGGCMSDTRLAVTVTLGDPSAPTGNSFQSFCPAENPTVADLSATGTGIQWYAMASGGSALSSSTALASGTTYYASQTISGCESDTRLAVEANVEAPAAPTGSSSQSFCAIDNPAIVNLTAVGTAIQWYSSASGGTALSTSTALASGTTYYAGQTTGGCMSDTRLAVTVTLGDPPAPTGSTSQSFCAINNPTIADLTAAGTAIQWYISPSGGTALSTSTELASGTTYYAGQTTGGCTSDTRLAVTVTLGDPPAPTGSTSQSFCAINNPTIADLTAAGTAIQWYTSPSGGTALSTSTALANGTTYYAGQTTGGCTSDTRLAVAVTVGDPSAPTGSSSQSFCAINNPTITSLVASGTAVQWYSAASGGSALSTSAALVSGTTYYAGQTTGGCMSDTRLAVAVTVGDPSAPTGSSSQSFCAINNPTITSLVASGTAVQWYSAASGGSALSTSAALVSGTTYYAGQTTGGCTSDTRLAVTVTVGDPPAPTGNTSQSFCAINNPTIANLVASGTAIQWYSSASGGSALSTSSALVSGTTYYAGQTTGGCMSDTRLAVTVNVGDPPAPTGSTSQSFCTINNPIIANLTAAGTAIQWYTSSSGGSALSTSTALASGTTYYSGQTTGGCMSDTRLAVTVTVSDPPAPTGNTSQSFCSVNNSTIANLTAAGTTIQWYPAVTGGTALSSSTPLISGTTYYAVQTTGGCMSDTRLAVTVTVADPPAPTGSSSQLFCSINYPTIANLTAAGTAIQWYSSASGGSALSTSTALVSGTTYHAGQTTGGCMSDTRLAVVVIVSDPAAPVVETITQPTCSVATGRVILTGLPASGTWTLTRSPGGTATTGTGTSTTISGLAAGSYTFTVTNASGCSSVSQANAVINPQPLTPGVPSIGIITQPLLNEPSGSVVINGLPASGIWTITRTPGGTTVTGTGSSTTISGLSAGTYSFNVTNASGCSSPASANAIIHTFKLYGPGNKLLRLNDTIKVDKPDAGSISIRVESDADWSVSDNSLWFRAVKENRTSTVNVILMENISAKNKVAPLEITYASNAKVGINIEQKARVSQLNTLKFENVILYPNPANDNVYLYFGDDYPGEIRISIASVQGFVLHTKELKDAQANQIIELNVAGLQIGQYLIQISDGTHQRIFQMIKY